MYLKKLYRQSKFWFVFVLSFALAQLFINYKNGLEVSPLYHYGMFSLPFRFAPSYECVEVSVNGRQLQTKDFTPNGWDNIVMPVIEYNHQQQWNSEMYNKTINRLLHFKDSTLYTSRLSQQEFDVWYHNRILRLLDRTDSAANVEYRITTYQFNNGVLTK